jgi:hypothetical protein
VYERYECRLQRKIIPAVVEIGSKDQHASAARSFLDERRRAVRVARQHPGAFGNFDKRRAGEGDIAERPDAPKRTKDRMTAVGRRETHRRRRPDAPGRRHNAAQRLRHDRGINVRAGSHEQTAAGTDKFAEPCASALVQSACARNDDDIKLTIVRQAGER